MEFGLVALWLLVYLALLYAGATLATALFPRFADRGVGVALPLALAVLWLVTYFVGRLSLTAGVWLGVLVLVALAAYAGYRGETVDRGLYLEIAAVFTVAFLFLVAIRSADPAIRPIGGEKFLDFGLLKSLLRADSLPPEDMWFAGEPVAYYYGGHLVAAILTKITGTAGHYAYNLALAGFYAALVTAVYGLAGSVAADRGISRRAAGAFGAFFVGIASNLSTPVKFLVWLLPDGPANWLAETSGLPVEGLADGGPSAFGYWDASRVIEDDVADFGGFEPNAAFVIDEFPFFSWLNGDLHAHMMSTAFLLLAAALCFAYYQTPANEVRRRRALLLGCLPPLAGLVAVVNTWSFPSVGGLVALTVILAPADPRSLLPAVDGSHSDEARLRDEGTRLVLGLGTAVVVLALGLLWSLPFWLGAASGREVAFLPDRSSMAELLLVHGVFLAAFVPYLYRRTVDATDRDTAQIVGLVAFGVAAFAASIDLAALGLFLPLILGGWVLRRGPVHLDGVRATPTTSSDGGQVGEAESSVVRDGVLGSSPVGFEMVLVVAGAGLVTLVEFAFVTENVGRMNTVFKTYMQVWVLWAVAGGVALAGILDAWPARSTPTWKPAAARIFASLLIVSASLYGGLALSSHFGGNDVAGSDGPTLDGRAWVNETHPDEAQAILWLDSNVEGRPTIVTGTPAGYSWYPPDGEGSSAPASMTGIPTVLGWHHEAQYRNESVYRERLGHVETIYTGQPDQQAALLDEYDVRYVYVGPAERNNYGEITVGDVAGVSAHRTWGEVTLYRVDGDELPE
jgi:YYY domain-containing protein